MKALGLCIGASNINIVLLEKTGGVVEVLEAKSAPHEGNPKETIKKLVSRELLGSLDRFAVTGRKLRHLVNAPTVSEPEALEYAYTETKNTVEGSNIIVSAGGETFMVYELDRKGKIIDVFTGNKCASGTGEFFLQQLKRMNMSIEEAVGMADLERPYKVAGRCSVFCKSDCTHALNKGAAKASVVAGLCEMMAGKIIELLKRVKYKKILVVGGTSDNKVMIEFLRKKGIDVHIPAQARSFEAFGAALWALEHGDRPEAEVEELFEASACSFSFLPALKEHETGAIFKKLKREKAKQDERCILGLDVGSTTTKAVLIREEDNAILASCYLRTNGDPVGASRSCYRELEKQLEGAVQISGLGVTGSGRQIAGLHALTPAVINEIIAHAAAAAYFDPEVDTIFEIGGQDAKYTYLTNGVPSDYAMNEACSAGTGSFLEEAAKESLNIETEQIGDIAMNSSRPPNFNDQCAAFIGSDIKSAIQMGLDIQDIAAGLVYSVCMNYINRVKGSRPVGQKVFMQGGVCYNKAVPVAMAALTGKEIIVPPEPGLMGAFGVALEVKNKLELGLLKPINFELKELAEREVLYKEPFTCSGGKEKCDRKCTISRIAIKDRTYPFGGACNKYYNLMNDKAEFDINGLDLVELREKLVFERFSKNRGKSLVPSNGKTVGINNSLLTNTLYPLYYNFFTALGFRVVCSEKVDSEGLERKDAAFCYPVEIAHGTLQDLINMKPDIYFIPHIKAMSVKNGIDASVTCPFVQSEPYYLKTAFRELENEKVVTAVLDFSKGFKTAERAFLQIGSALGCREEDCKKAYQAALLAQDQFGAACQEIGRKALEELERHPREVAVVLFGRPYNAFSGFANMGIPRKFASRGYKIIPYDFLPYGDEQPWPNMYWAMGQMILKAAGFVERHPQLFGAYITNFSCGPDSFLISYFRNTMGAKPSLTLELDGHTADAGLDTRIEAFIDVMKSCLEIDRPVKKEREKEFSAAGVFTENGRTWVRDSQGKDYEINDPRVHVIVPSMGDVSSKLLAATLRHAGVRAAALPPPAEAELKAGRAYSSCKECLPLILTIGSLISYIENRKAKDEILVYFMPETSGPCRFGQYSILMKSVVEKLRLQNVAMLSLTAENSYAGFGSRFAMRAWHSVIIADCLEEIYSAMLVLPEHKEEALAVYRQVCDMIVESVEKDSWMGLLKALKAAAEKLGGIEKRYRLEAVPKIALIGEIYVRRDGFSRQQLVERLAARGILVRTAPVAEWIYYCDYIVKHRLVVKSAFRDRVRAHMQGYFKNPFERSIKKVFASSGFLEMHMLDVERLIDNVADLISPRLTGETILTVGAAITEAVEEVDGVLSIGPFGCMPGRISEAVVSKTINRKKPEVARDKELVAKVMEHYPSLPFLSIETDGNMFPQIIESRLEAFCLQVRRIHERIEEIRGSL